MAEIKPTKFKEYLAERRTEEIGINEIFLHLKQEIPKKLRGHSVRMEKKGQEFFFGVESPDKVHLTDTFILKKKKLGKGYRPSLFSIQGKNERVLKPMIKKILKASTLA